MGFPIRNDMPDKYPDFPVIDGEERCFSPKVDEEGAFIGLELLPVPKDDHGRMFAKMVNRQALSMVLKTPMSLLGDEE